MRHSNPFSLLHRGILSLPFLCGVLVACVLGLSTAARAQSIIGGGTAVDGLPGGFGIDGNLLADSISDWTKLAGAPGIGVGVLDPVTGNPISPFPDPHILSVVHLRDPINNNENSRFVSGTKLSANPNVGWMWDSHSNPSKDDIQNALIMVTQDDAGNVWAHLAGDREAINGTSYIDFEILQGNLALSFNPADTTKGGFVSDGPDFGKTNGDIQLTIALPAGGNTDSLFVSLWRPLPGSTTGEFRYKDTTLGPGVAFVLGDAGTTSVPYGAFGGTTYGNLQFGEAAINLTAIFGALNPCFTSKTLLVKTKSSASPTAELKDFIRPIPFRLRGPSGNLAGGGAFCSGSGASVKLTVTLEGKAPWTYTLLDSVAGTSTIHTVSSSPDSVFVTPSVSTTFLLTAVTDAENTGCPAQISGRAVVTVNPNPTVTVNSPEVCANTLPATLTATPSGGTGSATFKWSTGATTSTISTSTAGTYSVTVTDTKGCTGSGSGTLTSDPNPSVSVPGVEVCNSALPATVTANGSGGTGSLGFSWSTGATTSTISTSTAGTYSVTVTDTKGCTGSGSGTLTVDPNPTVSIAAVEKCASALPATMTASASGGTGSKSFAWSTGATTSTISTSTDGTYSVTVTDTKGCTGSGSGTLTVDPNPTVSVNNNEACPGSSASLTATPSGGTGAVTFAWSTGATASTISTSTTGTYSVTVTDTKGCTGSGSGTFTANAALSVSVNNAEICSGGSATLTATPSGGTGASSFAWSTGATTSTISTGTAGTYSVTATDTKGCTGSGTGTLTVDPNPTVSIAAVEICASAAPATLTASASDGTGSKSFAWSTGATTSTISSSTAGTYSVTVTDTKGCTGSGSGTLTINPNPTVSVNNAEACQGFSNTLTATPSGGTGSKTFAWSTGATASTISPSTTGTYSVTVTDTKGCTGSGTGTFTSNAALSVSVNSPEVCSGNSATLTASPSGGTGASTFAWSTGATTSTISTTTGGTYSVTVTDTKGCTGSSTGTLTVNPNPTVSIAAVEVCNSATPAKLTASASGGTGSKSFAWSTGATTSTISTSTAGTYSVTVTDTKGCTGSGSGTLTVDPNPTVSVGNVEVCGSSLPATLTASPSGGTGSKTFAWSTGATTSSISTSTAGTYSVTVTDTKGCTGSGTGTLTVDPTPALSCKGDTISCIQSVAHVCVTVTNAGSFTSLSYTWSPAPDSGQGTSCAYYHDSGYVKVVVSDLTHGCKDSCMAHIVNVIPNISTTCGSGGPLTSTFELDGNAFSQGGQDWSLIYNGTSSATFSTAIDTDKPSKSDDYFQIGTKDLDNVPNWHYNIQSTPDKDDILHGGAAQYGSQLFFFGDRAAVNGDAQIGFWFFKNDVHINNNSNTFSGTHAVGDLLVLSNFVQGGGKPIIFAYEWVGSGGSDGTLNKLTLTAANSFAIVNSGPVPSPWPYNPKSGKSGTFAAGAFFEGGIDLACLSGVDPCFRSFLLETRSSQSVTASLKDFLTGRFVIGSGAHAVQRAVNSEIASVPKIPDGFALHANYPNPFNPTTQIKYELPEASTVRLSVYNTLGQEVARLVDGSVSAGYQTIEWSSTNQAGLALPSGVYMYRLEATGLVTGKEFREVRKMVLMK